MRTPACRWLIGLAVAGTAALLPAVPGQALDMQSASYRLRGGNVNGGGEVAMVPAAPGSGIGWLGASIGQSEALGYSGSLTTLQTNAPGFWPLVAGSLPMLDDDGDGIQFFLDNCPWAANPGQADSGGIGTGSDPDGTGDACQCGDVTDNGVVEINDATIIKRAILGLGPGLAAPLKCSVIGTTDPSDPDGDGVPADCLINDSTVVKRAILGLGPGISQVCTQALP